LAAAESDSVQASLPSVALGVDDNERKRFSKLSDTAKLAEGPPLLARTEETLARSRRAVSEPQAPATQPLATTAQPSRALGESLAADKPQQSAPSQLAGDLGAQASAARPEPSAPTTRFFREPAPIAGADVAKQKALRELDRLDSEPAVLSRFVIEQQGNSVRVVEADGSVYDGTVEEPVITEFDTDLTETFTEKKDQLAREKPVALKSATAPPTDGYSFRASGSNVTLRQMVVVNGRFAAGTNSSARSVTTGVVGGLGGSSRNTPMPRTTTTNRANAQRPAFDGRYGLATNQPATIEGTVRIGVTNQQWFRAVRDPR
jgi:hypothetical protein